MLVTVKIQNNGQEKQVQFPSKLSAQRFKGWLNTSGAGWKQVGAPTVDEEAEFTFTPDEGSEVGPLLLSTNFTWQLRSDTPTLGSVHLPSTGKWELWLL